MLAAPEIEKIKGEEVLKKIKAIVPHYTPELNITQEKGPEVGLLKIFASMIDTIVHRLNRVPDKNFIKFLEMLGVKLLPPQPARVPVTFVLSEGSKENVLIPEKTQTSAGEIIFETEKTFVATPSKLLKAYSVSSDKIFDAPPNIITGKKPSPFTSKFLYTVEAGEKDIFLEASAGLEKGDVIKIMDTEKEEYAIIEEIADAKITLTDKLNERHVQDTTIEKITEFELFKGKDLQEHVLYLGHKYMLDISGEAQITLNLPIIFTKPDEVSWEYYGKDEKNETCWHPLIIANNGEVKISLLKKEGRLEELALLGVKSRWIRCICKNIEDFRAVQITDNSLSSAPVTLSDLPVIIVQGIGEVFLQRLIAGKIDTVKKLLKLSPDELDKILNCGKIRAENILEAAEKAFYDKTDLKAKTISIENSGILPDMAFYNDIPLDFKSPPLHPFGVSPRLYDSFYIASREAFSKKGATVCLQIAGPMVSGGAPTPQPVLSWEYWDGNGWINMPGIKENFMFETSPKSITIENFPETKLTKVNGIENLWIRIRLAGGNYGQDVIVQGKRVTEGTVTPPQITSITITYTSVPQYPQHCLTYNNLEFKDVSDACRTGKAFKPFESFDGQHKALYLGFDKRLEKGPISIFFDIQEPESFTEARTEWEYFADVDGTYQWGWLEVLDVTNAFNSSGTVEFVFPDNFIKSEKFSTELYWIRTIYKNSEKEKENPIIKGIYLNSTWSVQAESITGELLGSSYGEAHQAFSASRFPVLSSEVWVDEITALSDGERRDITEKKEFGSKEVKDEKGNTIEFWIKWAPVDDLLSSSKDGRHYEVDGNAGYIRFGDGRHGMIPPIGKDNITANYRTGGGDKGNVGTLEINTLKTSIAFVDKVSNPIPSGGGADIEIIGNALDRGSHYIRNRGRCITEEDYEYIAKEASRSIVRARCIPDMNGDREFEPGCITVIIIPSTADNKPVPSLQLKTQTADYLEQHAAAAVIASDNLYITGPSYLKVSVEATIIATKMEDIPGIEQDAYSGLKNFLHPLKGGYEGTGWDFGKIPFYSDFYSILEKIKGVDYVKDLSVALAFEGEDTREWILSDVETSGSAIHPFMNAVMICSGAHIIRVSPGKETASKKVSKPQSAVPNVPLLKLERGKIITDIINVIKRK